MNPQFDAIDETIRLAQLALWDEEQGPRVGDYVKLNDGTVRRFTHDWGDSLQTTTEPAGKFGSSFFFGRGYMRFSGGLDRAIPSGEFELTGEILDGSCWIFHHDEKRAHNGVQCRVPCRVYRQKAVKS